ncbi:MAG: DUF177 domain-containing protein [Acetobacteraceae bacterium]|nr:DUF177 domain-containing protein [Acetobacteraceae bacterium]
MAQLAAGGEREVVATPAECAAIAQRLQIPAVAALSCRFRLVPAGDGVVAAEGRLAARVTRECVVTLELFEAELVEAFRLRFVPADAMEEDEDIMLDPDADDEVPYHGRQIDLGEAAVEQLALALDPYPRMQDAALPAPAQPGAATDDGAAESPFAALARRARKG